MSSPVRRAFLFLRQHFLLLGGPWLAVSAAGFIVWRIVQQVMIRLYPVVHLRTLQEAGYANMHVALQNSMRGNYIRLGASECVQIVEYAFKVIAVAVTVLLVAQIATHGADTFSAALERLRKIPAVVGTLLKFYLIVLGIGLGTALVTALLVAAYIPLWGQWHSPGLPKWLPMVSADIGQLLFLCVMPFLLDLVRRLERPSSADEDVPEGLLRRALGYGAVAVVAEMLLRLAMGPLRTPLVLAPEASAVIAQNLIGLATTLITALPTIVCVVAIALMVMDAAQPVTDAEPAKLAMGGQRIL